MPHPYTDIQFSRTDSPSSVQQEKIEKEKNKLMRGTELLLAIYSITSKKQVGLLH
jgi:hypothetical protein